MEEQQNKSTRSFEEWKKSLRKIIASKHCIPLAQVEDRFYFNEPLIRTYYDRSLMPGVCFNELFNK